MTFRQKLEKITKKNNSLLCIGLDPDLEKNPSPIFPFNKSIIDATNDQVCAYKPNIAFYEARGIDGLKSLKKTIDYLKSNYKDIPIILDAKRGDIGNTAKMYAKSAFEYWGADAVTVYSNLGLDSVKPFLEYKDKLTILLVKTSNPDSKMFQDLYANGVPYYLKMSEIIKKWKYDNIGIFVGATYPSELKKIRKIFPDKIFLSAGLGAQKGDIKRAVMAGIDENGEGIMYNASRSVLFSSNPREKAQELNELINKYRNQS